MVTAALITVYIKRLRRVGAEYIEARNLLKDIILSFNADLRQQNLQIKNLINRVEYLSSGSKLTNDIKGLRDELENIKKKIKELSDVNNRLYEQIDLINKRIEEITDRQSETAEKIKELESIRNKGIIFPFKKEREVMRIESDRALASLTTTELKILNILAEEGEKTASQIKEKIRLTREHTARLMKSLFIRGYVERNMERIPYTYKIKTEMIEILKKQSKNRV